MATSAEPIRSSSKSAARAPASPPSSELPAGPNIPHLAQSLSWIFAPIQFMNECRKRYGNTFTFRLAGMPPIVAIGEPAAVKEVFTGDPEVFNAGRGNNVLKPILGARSLLLLDGSRHLQERKLMMPPFHGERMQAYGQAMKDAIDARIDRFPIGRAFPLHHETQEVTLDVILRTVFGLEDGANKERLSKSLVNMLSFGEQPALLMLIGRDGELRYKSVHEKLGTLSPWSRFQKVITDVDDRLRDEIVARRKRGATGGSAGLAGTTAAGTRSESCSAALRGAPTACAGNDILTLLLEAKDEHGRGLTDDELIDEMKTLLVAGHETTATALTWTMLELLENPEVLAKLRRELDSDEYVDAVIRESLRLHPIVPMVARLLMAPVRVGGRDYPAGAVLAPNIYLTHRNPAVWSDPDRFDPDRFLGLKSNPYEFFPFGGGTRRCLGLAFAMFEMRVVLRRLVARADLRLAPRYEPKLVRRGITFAVSKGLPVVCDRVRPS